MAGGVKKEHTMDQIELIRKLQVELDAAFVAANDVNKSIKNQAYSMADGGATNAVDYKYDEAREHLRAAKELLDDEFLAD